MLLLKIFQVKISKLFSVTVNEGRKMNNFKDSPCSLCQRAVSATIY